MTKEELFDRILDGVGFELRPTVNGQYFLYDSRMQQFFPTMEEVVASEDLSPNLKEAAKCLTIAGDADGVLRVMYDGDNKDWATLFASSVEERATVYQALTIECDLDVDELLDYLCPNSGIDVMERLDVYVVNSYLDDLADMVEGTDYDGSLGSFDDAFELEERLLAHKDTDPVAKNLLEMNASSFEEMHFIAEDNLGAVDFDKVYEIQEQHKTGKDVRKEKSTMERD